MKQLFFKALATLCLAVAPLTTFAQTDTYPNKPIRIIVPFPAGGVTKHHTESEQPFRAPCSSRSPALRLAQRHHDAALRRRLAHWRT